MFNTHTVDKARKSLRCRNQAIVLSSLLNQRQFIKLRVVYVYWHLLYIIDLAKERFIRKRFHRLANILVHSHFVLEFKAQIFVFVDNLLIVF